MASSWAAALADKVNPPRADRDDIYSRLKVWPSDRQRQFIDARDWDVFYGGAMGGGKQLKVGTRIPTPAGWTTMGELEPGDMVFTEHGVPCMVLDVHPVDDQPVSYRLRFDDGTEIDACADHQWLTFTHEERVASTRRTAAFKARRRASRPSKATGNKSAAFTASITARNQARAQVQETLGPPAGQVRTTKEIAGSLRNHQGWNNHAIPVAAPLQLPEAELPIDPYVLGAWLGDGDSRTAGFTSADEAILDELRATGLTVTDCTTAHNPYAYRLGDTVMAPRANGSVGRVNIWARSLRDLGVFGNKHIPMSYLRASADQRMALLQGLMDTDGTITKTGQVSFTTTSEPLAEGFYELTVSLGWKVGRSTRRAKIDGRDCGPAWVFKWSADRPVFRLPRKLERQRPLRANSATRFRFIVACDEIPPTPMRCITVDNPTGLYLAGESMVPTHNSIALLLIAVLACVDHPRLECWMLRRTIPQLRGSLIKELREKFLFCRKLAPLWGGRPPKWNDNLRELTFPNGSRIRFLYAESPTDATDYYSQECQMLLVDERQLMVPDIVDQLSLRVRSGDPSIPVLGIRSAGNPGNIGHATLKERYVTAGAANTPVPIPNNPAGRARRFIPALYTDNPHLNDEYEANFDDITDPTLRQAMRDGDWDVFAGMVFAEWRWNLHVVKPFPVPSSWRRVAGIDYGFAAPWSVHWGAVDNDRRVWIYRELYQKEIGERRQAAMVLEQERNASEDRVVRYADPSMWSRRGDQHPLSEVYALAGCSLIPATNDRLAGVQRLHSYLGTMAPACIEHRAQGLEQCPLLHIFDTCSNLIRTLPALPRDAVHTEDVDTKAEDHAYDSTRYLLMSLAQPFVSRPAHADIPENLKTNVEVRAWQAVQETHDGRHRRKLKVQHHPHLGRLP